MRLLTALIPLALATALASPAFAAGSMQAGAQRTLDEIFADRSPTGGSLQLTGHGEVLATPDTAYVTSGVTSQGTTAKEALDANTADMTKLIETLKAAGIKSPDIQTSSFSVSPNYVYSDQKDANGYQLPPKIVGYTVSNQVSVHVRDLANLGSVLDQSVQVGANTISGINFAVEDPSALYAEARKAAFADARAKADLYVEAAGVELGALQLINEQQGYNAPPQPYMVKAMSAMADRAAPVPVEAGQLTFSIDVNVNWELEEPR